jgi:peptidoglycan/LPS O-acetylase OafA/YrhL
MPELDTLRGIAVLLVVLFHAFGFTYGLQGFKGVPWFLEALTMPGWVGVNLFFVLSGFLITGILLDTKTRKDYYQRFYVRRALRILPLYYATLFLLLVLVRAGLVARDVSWSFLGLSAIYLANVTSLFGVPMQYGVLWSLAVEEHFYLIWPAAVRSLSRHKVIVCGLSVTLGCLFLRVLYALFHVPGGGYTWLSADGLGLGAVLAAIARNPENPRMAMRKATKVAFLCSLVLFAAGAPFGILMARYFLGLTFRETAINLFFVGIVGLTLLTGTSRWRSVVNIRLFQFLGKISYGIYLTHMLIFELVFHCTKLYWPALLPAVGRLDTIALQFGVAGFLTIVLASLSRRYFEEPFLRLKDQWDARG